MQLKFLIFLILISSMSPCYAGQLEDTIQSHAVHLITKNTECSGVLIAPSFILTARHCTKESLDYVEINGLPKRYMEIGRTYKSRVSDLALIKVGGINLQSFATIADNEAARGDNLSLIGLSYDASWSLSRGFVMSTIPQDVNYKGDNTTYHAFAIACQGCDEGDSGAGVFNNAGELVGVFIAQSQNDVRSYMVPLSEIKLFLKGKI